MKLAKFRRQLQSYRQATGRAAKSSKDSHQALDRMHSRYRKFGVEERTMANRVLAEWALSDDENVRFDALALIDEFMIANTMPALHRLAIRIAASHAPDVRYELTKVNHILGKLANV
jgi:hypothetical protein